MKIRIVLFSLILAAATLAGADEVHFAVTGITSIETGRLTAFCTGHMGPIGETTPPPVPCEVSLLFHNLRGTVVKEETMVLQPGTGGFLDLRGSEVSKAGRVEIDPCYKVTLGAIVGGIQLIDNLTGLTTVLASPAALAVGGLGPS